MKSKIATRLLAALRSRLKRGFGRARILDPCPPEALQSPCVAWVASRRPLTIYSLAGGIVPLGLASALGPRLANRRVNFLVGMSWHMEDRERASVLARQKSQYEQRYPLHKVVLLGSSEAEAAAMSEFTAPVHLINHNIFVDENVFLPSPPQSKAFDAVYVARMTPWKRHELASEIPSAAHIFYREGQLSWPKTLAYHRQMRAIMPGHEFLNKIVGENFEWLSPAEVNGVMNSAHVGLCLSAEEGAMLASMEYLLAGLPIVSTPSRGGREHFFDPDYCMIVPPDPRAVREAVDALKARRIPPDLIRSRTLARVSRERERFMEILRACDPTITEDLHGRADWRDGFFRQVIRWRALPAIEAELALT